MEEPFEISIGEINKVENIMVTVKLENGAKGYGEGSPFPPVTGETRDGAVHAARQAAKMIESRKIEDYRKIIDEVKQAFDRMPSSNLAIETALLDAYCRNIGISMSEFFGNSPEKVTTDLTIGIQSEKETRRKAKAASGRGFNKIKLKTGNDLEKDVKTAKAVAEEIPEVELKIDANQGWTPKEAQKFVEQLESLGIEPALIEQPVHRKDIQGLKECKNRLNVPVAADESVFSREDALKIVREDAADIINIKTGKTGLLESLDIISVAEAANKELMIGCNIEGKIGIHAASHLVSGTQSFSYIDLDGQPLMAKKISETTHGPKIQPEGPGHGINPENLDRD